MKITTKERKKFRVRNKLKKFSSSDRLRLSIFRSANNISAQIIDDKKNTTLLAVSSVEKDIKSLKKSNKSVFMIILIFFGATLPDPNIFVSLVNCEKSVKS